MSSIGRFVVLAALLAACGPPAGPQAHAAPAVPAPSAPAPSAPAPAPLGYRLPASTHPLAYRLTLSVDPAADTIRGEAEIDLVRDAAGGPLVLHADRLDIDAASLRVAGGPDLALTATPVDGERVAFTAHGASATLPAGRSTLLLHWKAPLYHEDAKGAFAQKVDDVWYAFTQFEPVGARRLMPCFDEPAFKIPWQLTLVVPHGLVALSNTPVASQHDEGALTRVTFEPTPALPSYLLAFAVGPFELLDAGKSRSGVPIRVAVPRGHAAEATIAVEDTAPILSLLEDYFGQPYPFAKLDLVPIPDTVWFSAMENPGLITYVSHLLLTKPAERTFMDRRAYDGTAAHEMAHQWFGNLVTMAWWNDVWLNEGFASWMGDRTAQAFHPERGIDLDAVRARSGLMELDSRASTRKIREPANDWNGVQEAFDGITYRKGEAVIAMIEAWLGPEVFQKGIRLYLAQHARGNASYDDLAAALEQASGRDVHSVFDDFVDRTGVPFVGVTLVCDAGQKPRLELTQRRFVPFGSKLDRERTWHIPINVRWQAGKASGRAHTVLAGATGQLELGDAPACPDWVMPNDGATGYYRWNLAGAPFDRLRSAQVLRTLPASERIDVAASVNALVSAGELPYRRGLEMAMTLIDDPERHVRELGLAAGAGWEEYLPANVLPRYRAWVRQVYGAAARKAGFTPRAGESDDDKSLRTQLLWRVIGDGDDEALQKQATRLAWKWLDDRSALAPEMIDPVLAMAAHKGDARLYERYLAEARKADAAHDKPARTRFLNALKSFRDLALARRSHELVLGDEFSILESYHLLGAGTDTNAGRALAMDFITEHYDAIVARLPAEARASLLGLGGSCTPDGLARARDFFGTRTPREVTGPRAYASFVEREELCIAQHDKDRASLVEFLQQK